MQALWRSIRGIGNRQTSFEVARFQSLEISPANSKLLVQKKNASTCSRGVICLKNYSIALSPRNHLKNSYPAVSRLDSEFSSPPFLSFPCAVFLQVWCIWFSFSSKLIINNYKLIYW
ncbi:hypothetical protein HPP92_022358 [Vanilla planifolia]|uniref:Uncharacterized protein n=1 Tax=Vanilla planifolia TaxID=51239 RepID=A0A835PS25_VANPL|nr:hypothetical protein HPP92_022358 [Vanilla planifolia]